MGTKDKRVDAYIAKAPEFSRPILSRMRELVHEGCPDCEETLKWGAPTIMSNGKILCLIASFKNNCMINFWKGGMLKSDAGVRIDKSWGDDGRFTKVSELPSKREFIAYVKKAVALNADGAKSAPRVAKAKPAIPMVAEFAAALKKNAKAKKNFESASPSHRREYLEWITDAKREETRTKRIAQAVEWNAEGKARQWKYGA